MIGKFFSAISNFGVLQTFRFLDGLVPAVCKIFGLGFSFQLRLMRPSPGLLSFLEQRSYVLFKHLQIPSLQISQLYLEEFNRRISVVIQGSALGNIDVIRSNISRIRTYYPEVLIVLSTWQNENVDDLKMINGLVILQSKRPPSRGISNINLQIVSTVTGLRYAQSQGIDFVAKIRTDQEFLNPLWIANLVSHYLNFCTPDSNRRIVVSSMNTMCFRKYSVSDMLLFGHVDDLLRYWDVALDSRTGNEPHVLAITNFDSWSKARLAENYLSSHYLERLGVVLDFSLSQYYEILWKYFAIADSAELGQVWNKYTRLSPAVPANIFPSEWSEVSYSLWKNMPIYSSQLETIGREVFNN